MARRQNLLTHKQVQSLSEPGAYADGAGLYLIVRASRAKAQDQGAAPAKSWVFVYFQDRKRREIGLGGAAEVKLTGVRLKAAELRQIVQDGGDPKAQPSTGAPANAAPPTRPTFGEIANDVLAKLVWRNAKTKHQWEYSLLRQAEPLSKLAVDEVTTDQILAILNPIWLKTPESASRLRMRIEAVFDAATARGYRREINPARWKGHLSHLMPPRVQAADRHFRAMPYTDVGAFLVRLRDSGSVSANALLFTILTAARSGEALGATWGEIDLEGAVWTVPGHRMKAGREHRVPLVGEALKVLEGALTSRGHVGHDAHIFPGTKQDRSLSGMAMEMVLRRMKAPVTVHGFRSSFRDWVGEETDFPREIAEAALAHVVGDKVERAYRRGDALAKRRLLMEAWDAYLRPAAAPSEEVVPQASDGGSELAPST